MWQIFPFPENDDKEHNFCLTWLKLHVGIQVSCNDMSFCFSALFPWSLSCPWHPDFFHVQDFGAFTSPQVETSGSTKSGAQTVQRWFLLKYFFMSSFFIHLPIVCFLMLAFSPDMIFLVCLALFVWLWTHLDADLGEQNITQGHLSLSANPRWLTVTSRPLCPGVARYTHTGIQEIDFF